MNNTTIEKSYLAITIWLKEEGYTVVDKKSSNFYIAQNDSAIKIAIITINRGKKQPNSVNGPYRTEFENDITKANINYCSQLYYVMYLEGNGIQVIIPRKVIQEYFNNPEKKQFTVGMSESVFNKHEQKGIIIKKISDIFPEFADDLERMEYELSKKPIIDVLKQALQSKTTAKTMETKQKIFPRDPYVSYITKHIANGLCQLCNIKGPFIDKSGNYYLESHHIHWLAHGGPDTIENSIALCPNCHKKMHIINDPLDVKKLLDRSKANYKFILNKY